MIWLGHSGDLESFEFGDTTHGELLEDVPEDLMSLAWFAADVSRGTLESRATFALDETQEIWVRNFCSERIVQLSADIHAVHDLEKEIEGKLASRRAS